MGNEMTFTIIFHNWREEKPDRPGKYYITNREDPKKKDIIEINIYTESGVKDEIGTLIAPLSNGMLMFYSGYRYFSGPFEI